MIFATRSLPAILRRDDASIAVVRTARLLAVATCGASLLTRFCAFAVKTLAFPYPLDYGEGAVLDGALRLARLENLYPRDLTSPPWFVANYPPLYYAVHVPVVWVLGHPTLWYGRLLSQLSAVAISALLAGVVYRLTSDVAAAALAALVWLTIPIVVVWAQYDRVDMFALALAWAGLWNVVRGERRRHIFVAAMCFVAATFTRQTAALGAFPAGVLWVAASRGQAEARRLFVWTVVVGAAVAAALQLAAGGFIFHVVTGTVGSMDRGQLINLSREVAALMPFLIAVLALFAFIGAAERPTAWILLAAYVPGAAVNAFAAAKAGSYINYFLDVAAVCSLAVGLSVARLRLRPPLLTAFLVCLVAQIVSMSAPNALYDHLSARLARISENAHLRAAVQETRGPILADEPMALLPLTGRAVDFQPFAMTQLAAAGLWDESGFVTQVRAGRYALVLLRTPTRTHAPVLGIWSRSMIAAILDTYQLVEHVPVDDNAFISMYRPRTRY